MQAGAEAANLAKVKILFGEDYQTNGESYLNFQGTFSSQSAQQQISDLQSKTSNSVDIEWSMVVEIAVLPENKQELLKLLNQMTCEATEELEESEIHHQIYEKMVQPGWFEIKIYDQGDRVFVSFKPVKGFDKDVIQPFKENFEKGLSQLVQTDSSTLNVSLSTNKSTKDYIAQFDNQERLQAVLCDSAKLDASLQADQEIFAKILNVVKNMEGEIFTMMSEFGAMLLAFNNIDVDLKFDSVANIPQVFRQKSFFGQEFTKIWNGEDPIHQLEKDALLRGFLKTIDTDVNVYFTVPEFLSVQINGHAAHLSTILEKLFF